MIGPSRCWGCGARRAFVGCRPSLGAVTTWVRRDLEPLATNAQPYLDLCDGRRSQCLRAINNSESRWGLLACQGGAQQVVVAPWSPSA